MQAKSGSKTPCYNNCYDDDTEDDDTEGDDSDTAHCCNCTSNRNNTVAFRRRYCALGRSCCAFRRNCCALWRSCCAFRRRCHNFNGKYRMYISSTRNNSPIAHAGDLRKVMPPHQYRLTYQQWAAWLLDRGCYKRGWSHSHTVDCGMLSLVSTQLKWT